MQFISTIDFSFMFLFMLFSLWQVKINNKLHHHRLPNFTGGVSKVGDENPQI